MVKAKSRQCIGQALIHLMIWRVESEPQLDTTLELVDIFVGNALASSVLAVLFTPMPRLVPVDVRRP
uniref:Uncharacterized protein n=1 Tax=Rhizophora mucronata TaxID=61149 RepID=A0A2P2QHB6_RHIMU